METIENIDYHINDRCNLNCIGCGHFAPLVPKSVNPVPVDQVSKDLNRLKLIVGDKLDNLNITGGECTTHPKFKEVLEIACELFAPKVTVYTNGTLYRKLGKPEIRDIIKKYGIKILMSDYNQSWYDDAVNYLSSIYGDQFNWISRRDENDGIIYFIHQFLSSDEVASDEEILNCIARRECLQLIKNRLYVCQYAAYFHYFDDFFKGQHNLKLSDNEGYIDLDTNPTIDDIFKFIETTKFDLCKHCIDCKQQYDLIPWRRSSKDISEWFKKSC